MKRDKLLKVRVSDAEKARMEEFAKKREQTISWLVRKAVWRFISKNGF